MISLRFSSLSSFVLTAAAAVLVLTNGCSSPTTSASQVGQRTTPAVASKPSADKVTLREGDVVQITFPGAAALNTTQTIRRDGRIVLSSIGELQVAGLTPAELSAELSRRYGPQLVHKEVLVTLLSSPFSVFVSGAVLRPGKIVSDRPLSALEAVMEAGGFDASKANLKGVVIIRNGRALPEKVDLKRILDGKEATPFVLEPGDIVHVPDRLVIF